MCRLTLISIFALSALLAALPASFAQQSAQAETTRKIISRVTPVYPKVASTMHLKGMVRVDVTVAPNGTVKSLDVKGGHPLLVEAATDAVRKWRWAPAAHETHEPVIVRFDPDN